MTNIHPYFEVADRMEMIATLVGKRTKGVVSSPGGPSIVDPGLGLESHASELFTHAEDLKEGTTRIAAAGGVSAGKTTLLCAITGLELPMGVDAKTGVITEIVHGDDPNTVKVFYTDHQKTISMEEFKTFSALPAGSIKSGVPFPLSPHLMSVRSARVQSSSAFSQEGIILIDTLGFGAGKLAADVTREKLRETDIAVLVLGTRPPFSDDDVTFVLEQLAEAQINDSKLRHIFWVLNDFNLREDEKAEVWASARVKLEGLLDEEDFEKQVFMVHAFDALEARRNDEPSETLENTGLPALERAIKNALQGRKQRVIESVVSRQVAPVIRVARAESQKQVTALDLGAEPLEKAVAEGHQALKNSREKAKELLRQLNSARDEFIDAVISNYTQYFSELSNEEWEQAWTEVAPKIGMFEFAISVFSKGRRERLEARLRAPLERLIGGKLEEWGDQLPTAVSSKFQTSFQDFEDLAMDFAESLVDVDESLVVNLGIDPEGLDVTRKEASAKRVLQMILGVFLLDPSQVVGAVYAPDWRSFLRRMVIELIAVVAAIVLFGPLGFIAVIGVVIGEFLLNILIDQESRKDRLAARVALKIREQFTAESAKITDQIRSKLNDRFKESYDSLDALLGKEISERVQRLDELLESRNRESSTADAERERLHRINAAITDQWHAISKLVYGKVIDETVVLDGTEDEDDVFGTPVT